MNDSPENKPQENKPAGNQTLEGKSFETKLKDMLPKDVECRVFPQEDWKDERGNHKGDPDLLNVRLSQGSKDVDMLIPRKDFNLPRKEFTERYITPALPTLKGG